MQHKGFTKNTLLLAIGILAPSFNVLSAGFTSDEITPATNNEQMLVVNEQSNWQVADKDFVFDPSRQSIQWQNYFDDNDADLAAKKETFLHWVGFHSINPTIVLTLIDMHSGILTSPGKRNIDRPFGALSEKENFSEQLNDVLSRLSRHFYEIRKQQKQEFQSQGVFKQQQTAASQALSRLLSGNNKSQNGHGIANLSTANPGTVNPSTTSNKLEQLFKSHRNLFKNDKLASATFSSEPFNSLQAATIATIKLQLPWSLGYSWTGGGSHGYDGSSWPHSSIDYSYDWPAWGGQTWSVRSAHGGTVTVLSSCQIRVTNSSGWATNYYHMSNVNVYTGQQVNSNYHLGYYASNKSQALCQGGSSTGPHLHFSLLKDGYYYSLDDVELSNYKMNTGRWSYDSHCSYFNYNDNNNYGQTKCGWSAMYNYSPK